MKLFRSNHPEDIVNMDTSRLRERFLIERILCDDKITMNYVQDDRMIIAGAVPVTTDLHMDALAFGLQAETFALREFGIINLGGPGVVRLGDQAVELIHRDGLYIGTGNQSLDFASLDAASPARFYIASTPAHQKYENVHIPFTSTRPLELGTPDKSNVRTIHQYIHPEVCQSAQLLMGMTNLAEGSLWNTMPCHTHDRRMEVYFYFNLPPDERVFHMMGEIDETRHIVVESEQGVIAPSWSIHTGVGTSSYSFIWSMAGENQVFEDMDAVDTATLR